MSNNHNSFYVLGLLGFLLPLLLIGLITVLVAYFGVRRTKKAVGESNDSRINNLSASQHLALERLSPEDRLRFETDFQQSTKSVVLLFVLWVFGFHYLYLGRVGLQFAYWFSAGGFGVWTLVDWVRMPSLMRADISESADRILGTLSIAGNFRK